MEKLNIDNDHNYNNENSMILDYILRNEKGLIPM